LTTLRLFGGGIRATVIVDFVRWRLAGRFKLQGFYDDNPAAGAALGIPRLGDIAEGLRHMSGDASTAVLALGTYASWRACELLNDLGRRRVPVASLLSPMAFISPSAEVGPGALILDGVFIGARARIGALLTANASAIVEHDTTLGHNIMLGSGAAIAGFARVEDHCFIGTNATVLPKVVVGSGTLLAAGSTASRDLPTGVIAVGAPARASRSVREGDEVPTPALIAALPRI
jgi:sugar O-acyltransferase (sialic acid O-acetyltransferase NeuD family)